MYLGTVATGMASITSHSNDCHTPKGAGVILTSNSFNAHKSSSFTIVGQMQEIERGLTLIHFNTPEKFEYATFDTYASEEAVDELIAIIQEMQKNNAVFAILAHDSAANGSMKQSDKLSKLGLLQLSTLKGRQAYIMHNFYGKIDETVDNLSTNLEVNLSEKLSDTHIYFPQIKYSYVPNIDRYIAHGGGEVNGIKSTNSKEALDESYRKGFRLFEMDITETSDGKWVASHDWNMWARFTDYEGSLPPSYSEFMKHKIYGDYTTLDLKAINEWFRAHPDATLVTDKVNDPIAFANAFVDKSRLIMELFSLMSVEEASKNGINAMISQDPLLNIVGDKINYLEVNKVKFVSLSRKIIANQAKLMLQLRDHGIKVYVYNVNFDPGKDEKYVEENEFGLIYGMYADKWVFDNKAVLSN
jgi:hypothetical protein